MHRKNSIEGHRLGNVRDNQVLEYECHTNMNTIVTMQQHSSIKSYKFHGDDAVFSIHRIYITK